MAYGTRNNVDARLSYLWDISRRDCLNFNASFYGMNGKISSSLPDADDWKSRFYRTDASLDYRHGFRNVSLSLGGSFASQVFNYMPSMETSPSYTAGNDRQHYTLGEGYVGVTSVQGRLPVDFAVQTGFRRFDRKYEIPFLGSGAENAKLILDSWHWIRANQPFDQSLLADIPADKIVSIQLNDVLPHPYAKVVLRDESMHERVLPGKGCGDTAGFVKMISEKGVDPKVVGVEVINDEILSTGVANAAKVNFEATQEVLKAAWPEMAAE